MVSKGNTEDSSGSREDFNGTDGAKEDELGQASKASSAANESAAVSPSTFASSDSITKSKKPKDTALRQQRLPAWQPILTPYNTIPILFILALVFIPVGVLLLVFANQVQEYQFDYTDCLQQAPIDSWASAPGLLGNVPFEWRRLSRVPDYLQDAAPDFNPVFVSAANLCELRFSVTKDISGPVLEYYRLSNYYQNDRLYVKSVSLQQLRGEALTYSRLQDCSPLVGPSDGATNPETGNRLVYYPCGLVANSMFNDTIGGLGIWKIAGAEPDAFIQFPPKDITWTWESKKYGASSYNLDDVLPPPYWASNSQLVGSDGRYRRLPDLSTDERFQNWMQIAGLPIFRKPYGKTNDTVPAGLYSVLINSVFEVSSYGATKAFVLSNTSWLGGNNPFLGYAYIVTGTIFLAMAIAFLIKHLLAPRRLGDVRYLSWNQK